MAPISHCYQPTKCPSPQKKNQKTKNQTHKTHQKTQQEQVCLNFKIFPEAAAAYNSLFEREQHLILQISIDV